MQTLRKKTSPLKYKNETSRFMGEGVSFKAKLIGILEVSEARGDRMCQEALSDLKMAIRAAGEHKQRITITIAIDGLRLRDEKTGDSLYHHPVHKISFIAQDMTDSRAFGYIFGSPDTGHRFFGIKTDKAASQVVIAMRDLFQVVFALKKKEIELAKQHLEKSSSPLFPDSSSSYSKLQSVPHVAIKSNADTKLENVSNESKNTGTAVADLVDLELELNSLQQGLNQMERITPLDPFGSKDDPFGDSFISYPANPILPPPPSSGRERSNRTSESSSLFSPKTPHTGGTADSNSTDKKDFTFSHEFDSSHDDPSSADWFTPTGGHNIFEEPPPLPNIELVKDEKHEQKKQEIMSQFDVFTELDPLGTGRSKPYIDRKHFFQELKNPPKKALNELVSSTTQEQSMFNTTFNQKHSKKVPTSTAPTHNLFSVDPFGEDPFVRVDPFADSDFSKQDPFESEFSGFPNGQSNLDKFKFNSKTENLQTLVQNTLQTSPKGLLENKVPILSTSPKMTFMKQNTFDIHLDKFEEKQMYRMHENKSLDISSESECAPEPPPRPAAISMQIKPPPLPPKKQMNDLTSKPPPRPPYHTDESPYDFIEKYETAPNSLEFIKNLEKSPPLPVPARKAKFDSDFAIAPERPKKQFSSLSEDDYLTPVSLPEKTSTLLPPPQKSTKKQINSDVKATADNIGTSLEGLDITLSQLTLSGLNELAQKLNIPAGQLSNMTLVQLTNFLSNFIKSNSNTVPLNSKPDVIVSSSNNFNEFPTFQADFATNFNNMNNTNNEVTYDRYAVFRELIQEEIKQTKIDSEPEEILEEKEKLGNVANSDINLDLKPLNEEPYETMDKYAALREIVEKELKQSQTSKEEISQTQPQNEIGDIAEEEEEEEEEEEQQILNGDANDDLENIKIMNKQNDIIQEEKENDINFPIKTNILEYSPSLDTKEEKIITAIECSMKPAVAKSPTSNASNEIGQNNVRLTSGSLSDVVSGSSPEVDMMAGNSDIGKKASSTPGESWAIFDQATISVESIKEKQTIQSEEGVSPWSSDSKEFGNGSPTDWRSKDSGSGPDQWSKKRRDQEGWWDTSAEPEAHYCSSNRRSTDSYDEEYYECYDDKPRRRRQPAGAWQHGGAGGHSSSSRDVSPWEEEPRRTREGRGYKHPRGFDRHRRVTDSWDEDDDYEYDDEDGRRFHWPERHGPRDTDRESRHSTGSRDIESDRWGEDWSDDRRHRRRRDLRDRWCCPDWDQGDHEKSMRYSSGRWSNPEQAKWRDRKHDDRYYSRESQESPWEDEYPNEQELSPYYLSAKRNWKQRPSSASEMDRKTGEIKSRHYLGTGGSDGERDRRYKGNRRSRSRDSQYSEPSHRHKPDLGPPIRSLHRNKPHSKPLENEFSEKKLLECKESNKKTSTLTRKKTKDSPKTEENMASTFPRKSSSRGKLVCETSYIPPEEGHRVGGKYNFDHEFETSEVESPTLHPIKTLRQQTMFEKSSPLMDRDLKDRRGGSLKESKLFSRYPAKAKSMFEDDFSPGDKSEQPPEEGSISSIKEEIDREEDDEFDKTTFENATNGRRKILSKNRMPGSLRMDSPLKKSESVNIFAREDDPFDDDFFSGENIAEEKSVPRSTELRWTEDFKH